MKKRRAFSLIEALLALALISLALGLVAQAMAKLSKVMKASDRGALKVELHSGLQRLCTELASAQKITIGPSSLTMLRVDPSLNRSYNESRPRLPWPLPATLSAVDLDPNLPVYQISVTYSLQNHCLQAVDPGETRILAAELADCHFTAQSDPHLLEIELVPQEAVNQRKVSALAYMPMVKP